MWHWYHREIIETGKQPLAVLLVAFMLSFLAIRLSVRMIRAGVRWWPGNVSSGGLHLHHMVFGAIFMLVGGAGGFSSAGNYSPAAEIFAAAFGCGAALVLDEFALILHLKDVYWSESGRISVDAVFLAAALIGLLLLGVTPFGVGKNENQPSTAWAYPLAILPNALLVVITLLKGKVWTGLLGILVPVLALVGAIRLARPASPWAHWRYRLGSRKATRAGGREDRQHARWQRWRHRVEDVVAGKPT